MCSGLGWAMADSTHGSHSMFNKSTFQDKTQHELKARLGERQVNGA